MADRKISSLPLRDKHPELRAAIASVVGHENFLFLVLAEEPDGAGGWRTVQMSNSDEAMEALRRLAATGRST